MQFQISWWVVYRMLIIFRIMPGIKCPLALTKFAMNVACFVACLHIAHYSDTGFQLTFVVGGSKAHKSLDHFVMVLSKHTWHHIILGRKIKQGKKIFVLRKRSHGPGINIAKTMCIRVL